ncbi:MAG: replicative DNA helicase [Pseudomonadota bacterium]
MENAAITPTDQLKFAAEADEPVSFRHAPHNIEAEQALLGAILINNEALDRVTGFLDTSHFFEPLHGQIYDVAVKLIQSGKQATPITMRTFFENVAPVDENLTVAAYLGRLAANATTIINARDYGRAVYDLAVRRSLIQLGEEMVNTAYDSPVDQPPGQQIEEAEEQLYLLAEQDKYGQGFVSFDNALTQAVDMANNARMRGDRLSGLPTGLHDLDGKMGGLQPSDLIIIAGRPSMGKTALVTNIAMQVAQASRLPTSSEEPTADLPKAVVGFFSLEMSAEQLAARILSEQSEISSSDIRRGQISEDEVHRLINASQRLAEAPLFIDQTGGISIAQLAARARRLKRQHGLDLLIVDYLQLLSGSAANAAAGRVQEMTEITTGLKALAKELSVPVIALSQLSRQVEQREDKRPQLSDLRESGSIEQDADAVLFVFREEYYLERAKPAEGTSEFTAWLEKTERACGRAEVIIAKQRHGPTGTAHLAFQAEYTRFADLAEDDYIPDQYE